MLSMVDISFHHSRVTGISDCEPCLHCAKRSQPAFCKWDHGASPAGIVVLDSKSRPGHKTRELQYRGVWASKAGLLFETGRAGIRIQTRTGPWKAKFRTRTMRNEDIGRGNEGGERILTQNRGKEEDSIGSNGERKAGLAEESYPGECIATAAKVATLAVEISTDEFVEKSKASLGIGAPPESPDSAEVARMEFQNEQFLRRLAAAENADVALAMITEIGAGTPRVLKNEECSQFILVAIAQNNVDLAFSILKAMRRSALERRKDRLEDASGDNGRILSWTWPQPEVSTYVALVQGLAASLRVSDAIKVVADLRRRGVPQGDEVPFGKVVNCPTCKTSLAVVQPQQGRQLVPCALCRYQYEIMSGDVVTSESESISSEPSFWEKGLRVLPFLKRRVPAAVHSVVVQSPDGLAQTHRFATESADVPAQEGERVSMVLACPANVGPGLGPIRFNARAPGWQPREPMAVTNHVTGLNLSLIKAPPKVGNRPVLDTSSIVPIAILLATTDMASGLIDPALPRLVAVGAVAVVTLGGAANTFLLPKLNQLPQRTVDAITLRQRLLAQYQKLQARLQDLTQSASNEVRMLARMCQLQNKMEAVGEASYSARIERVCKARDGLLERLAARLELMDSYAKIASMIEIEVEMDVDVLAAEAASPEASIAEQIERLMEVESLQKEWKNQAEANDEVEKLLRAAPLLPDTA